MVKSYILV